MARNWIVFIHWIIICLWFKWLFLTKRTITFFCVSCDVKELFTYICIYLFHTTQYDWFDKVMFEDNRNTVLLSPVSCLSFTLHVVPLCHYMYNYNLLKTTINDQPFFFPVWWIFSSNFEYVSVLHVLIYLVSDATFNLYDPLPSCFGCKRREYFIALYGGRVLKQIVVQ